MRSITQTITISQVGTSKPASWVVPQSPLCVIRGKIDQLTDKMAGSGLFSAEELASIARWKEEIAPRVNKQGVQDRTLAVGLASLLFDTIRPAALGGKEECLDFEDTLVSILSDLLPDTSVEAFIEELEKQDMQRELMEYKLQQIESSHPQNIQMVCAAANRENQHILHTHAQLKETIRIANASCKEMAHEVNHLVDFLTEEVEGDAQTLTGQATQTERVADRMEREEATLKRLLAECKALKG